MICTSASVISAAVTLIRSPQNDNPNLEEFGIDLEAAVVPVEQKDESPFAMPTRGSRSPVYAGLVESQRTELRDDLEAALG